MTVIVSPSFFLIFKVITERHERRQKSSQEKNVCFLKKRNKTFATHDLSIVQVLARE